MRHAGFILAAYGIAVAGLAVMLLASWVAMRRAERRAAALREQRR